jgi:hypothetical protein
VKTRSVVNALHAAYQDNFSSLDTFSSAIALPLVMDGNDARRRSDFRSPPVERSQVTPARAGPPSPNGAAGDGLKHAPQKPVETIKQA